MGLKAPAMPLPPPVDPEVSTREAESAAKLEAEKKKAIGLRKKGMGGTILTGGQGVEEEAKTASTSLMQY